MARDSENPDIIRPVAIQELKSNPVCMTKRAKTAMSRMLFHRDKYGRTIKDIVDNLYQLALEDPDSQVRTVASTRILEYGLGKPPTHSEMVESARNEAAKRISEMSPKERLSALEALLADRRSKDDPNDNTDPATEDCYDDVASICVKRDVE
jgi:hypothetical protein